MTTLGEVTTVKYMRAESADPLCGQGRELNADARDCPGVRLCPVLLAVFI